MQVTEPISPLQPEKTAACEDMSRFYYVKEERRSYRLEDLLNSALKSFKRAKKNKEKKCVFKLRTPKKTTYSYDIGICIGDCKAENRKKIIKTIKEYTIVDWSATTGQTKCPISLRKYKRPYILNLNGRTYSKKHIKNAIESSLYKDESLRLEDMTIQPSLVASLKLFPNLTLWNDIPRTIVFSSDKIQYAEFNEAKARSRNIPGFVEYMKECPPESYDFWDYNKIYNKYADYHHLSYFTDKDEIIENLVIKNMKFPPYHPKCAVGSITFKNILFENCEIDMSCWCGVRVRSSRFTECTLNIGKDNRGIRLPRTEFVDCKIIVRELKSKGSYEQESQIRSVLSQVLADIETLKVKDCTLTSV